MKLLIVVIACVISVFGAGCSVDEFSNPQRASAAECQKRGGKLIGGKFCLVTAKPDAGSDSGSDSGSDAGDMQPDTGAGESCNQEQATRPCDAEAYAKLQPPCQAGIQTCRDGIWSICEGEVTPNEETCDGTDEDCDGTVDESPNTGCPVPGDIKGPCSVGRQFCQGNKKLCAQVVFPSMDVCNDIDDDCDGETDEKTAITCYEGSVGCTHRPTGGWDCRGTCLTGEKMCVKGTYSTDCRGMRRPATTEHCTLSGETEADENCDGEVDEGCQCTNGATCYSGSPVETQNTSPCRAGTRKCTDPTHGRCENEVTPNVEDCSNPGVDDDCNGTVDDVPLLGTSCADVSEGKGKCKAEATWQCSGGQLKCVDGTAGAVEVCDAQNVDENCDGTSNENFDLQTDENNCGSCNNKCSAELTCCSGVCVSTDSSNFNCGSCGTSCNGLTCCNQECRNLSNDLQNCGQCNNVCPKLLGLLGTCSAGACK